MCFHDRRPGGIGDARIVHDLNANPELPYADESFDFVLNAVSVQYLTQPIRVFQSVARVLRPGGYSLVAISHRLFPTKAIYAWQTIPPAERPGLVEAYFQRGRVAITAKAAFSPDTVASLTSNVTVAADVSLSRWRASTLKCASSRV